MKVNPIKKYRISSYPTREQFIKDKMQLKENIPESWKSKKVITGALAVFLFGSSTSNSGKINDKNNQVIFSETKVTPESKSETKIIKEEKTPSIAPLFIYGDGRGASGCVVINPPVFMSESDARQLIESELKKEGIIFNKKNYQVENLFFDENSEWGHYLDESEDDFSQYRKKEKYPVEMDAYSSDLNLAYEFVAVDDYFKFGGEVSGSTAQGYDLIEAAENLRYKMKRYGKINTVIFYDPLAKPERGIPQNSSYEALKSWNYGFKDKNDNEEPPFDYFTAKNEDSVILLKKQISDFIEWIKKEGLINKK